MDNESEFVKLESAKPDLNLKKIELEKESVLKELEVLKKTYDQIILENKKISLELIEERDKVVKLMTELKTSNGDKLSLDKYKSAVKVLQEKFGMMSVENEKLKEENILIKKQNEVVEVDLKESQKKSEELKRDLESAFEKSSKLLVSGTTIVAYKLKTSGELIVTEKANKVDGISISFVIAKNELAKPVAKVYYIQVINSENTVLGDVNGGVHHYKGLTYSLATNVNYEKKMVRVFENFLGNKFAKGTYYVNVYDKEELVDEATFILK